MRFRYARLTTAGPVRETNEDYVGFWEADDPLAREKQGTLAALADGVGGYEGGEVASRLAVEEALQVFAADPPDLAPYAALRRLFSAACGKVYQARQDDRRGPMATTL